MKNIERVNYLNHEVNDLLERDPIAFLGQTGNRIMKVATDVFPEQEAIHFLASVLETGKPDPADIERIVLAGSNRYVREERAPHLAVMLAYEMLRVHRKELYVFREEGLFPFWETLENAGMSDEQIGHYFERFSEAEQ